MAGPSERETGEDLSRDVKLIVANAVDVLAFDAATVSVRIGDNVATVAATDERLHDLDMAQYEAMDGPCVTVLEPVGPIYLEDIVADDRWPSFCEVAEAAGVRTSLSLNVTTSADLAATLNLYARRERVLADQDIRQAQACAAQLAAALRDIETRRVARLAEHVADAMCVSAIRRALGQRG
jgi:hypothetical protein